MFHIFQLFIPKSDSTVVEISSLYFVELTLHYKIQRTYFHYCIFFICVFTFRWQQNLIGLLAIDIASDEGSVESVDASIILDSSLGYRTKGDSED